MSISIIRAGTQRLFLPDMGIRAYPAGAIGGAGVTSTRSVNFDGSNDYIDCGTSAAVNPSSAMSISLWAKAISLSDPFLTKCLIARWTHPDPAKQAYAVLVGSSGDIALYWTSSGTGGSNVTSATGVFGAGAWHHVVVTFDAGNVVIYYDGNSVKTGSGVTSIYQSDNPLNIGVRRQNGGDYFHWNGLIDDVRIYNTPLDSAAVSSLYAGDDVTAGLVGYWPLEEGTGTTTADTIGGNTGTLTSCPTWSTDVPASLA
jgi:hypothetical protein